MNALGVLLATGDSAGAADDGGLGRAPLSKLQVYLVLCQPTQAPRVVTPAVQLATALGHSASVRLRCDAAGKRYPQSLIVVSFHTKQARTNYYNHDCIAQFTHNQEDKNLRTHAHACDEARCQSPKTPSYPSPMASQRTPCPPHQHLSHHLVSRPHMPRSVSQTMPDVPRA